MVDRKCFRVVKMLAGGIYIVAILDRYRVLT